MKRVLRYLGLFLGALILVAGGGLAYLRWALPPYHQLPTIALPEEPERIERGRYLANHVALCVECHSVRDTSLYAGPVDAKTLGRGGEAFPGDFGVLYAPNITPAGVGAWSDQELYRAVVTGVSPGDRSLFPLMPFPHYATADSKDIEDILAYIRQLPSQESSVPASRLNVPFNLLVRTMSVAPSPTPLPKVEDKMAYGAYMTNLASCTDCHTPMEKGSPIPGLAFAGGNEFQVPGGTLRSPNITPDKRTGIGSWSREAFIARFKNPAAKHNRDTPLAAGEFNTIMPWRSYAGMTDQDLGAIYDYLATVPAVERAVLPFTPTP